jgi:hypothetical protein
MNEQVTIGIASIPERISCLKAALESLLPQLGRDDTVTVYLNGYDTVPDWMARPDMVGNIIPVLSSCSGPGDTGDAGKFYGLNRCDSGYYFALDDDYIYPPTFIQDSIAAAEKYDRQAAVSLHGWDAKPNQASYHRDRAHTYHYKHDVPQDTPVHIMATNTLCFHRSLLPNLSIDDFKRPNMADLWFSMYCNERGVRRIVRAHGSKYIKDAEYDKQQSIWARFSRSPEKERFQTDTLNGVVWDKGTSIKSKAA